MERIKEMETYICDQHLTSARPERKPPRTILQMRLSFAKNDRVAVTEEYKNLFNRDYGIGVILEFKDPYEWETCNAIALIQFPCGCKNNLEVSWLS